MSANLNFSAFINYSKRNYSTEFEYQYNKNFRFVSKKFPRLQYLLMFTLISIFLMLVFGAILALIIEELYIHHDMSDEQFISIIPLGFLPAAIFLYIINERHKRKLRRLFQFAEDNKIRYILQVKENLLLGRTGSLFNGGGKNHILDMFIDNRNAEIDVEYGNLTNRIGLDGFGGATNTWGYVTFKLPRNVPNMLLMPRGKKKPSEINFSVFSDQKLMLEGNFNEHFTLYCPKDYEQDAYYIFTPNLMAAMIDRLGGFGLETIDNQVIMWTKKFKFNKQQTFENIYSIINYFHKIFYRQTKKYRDDKSIIDKTNYNVSLVMGESDSARSLGSVGDRGRRLQGVGVGPATAIILFIIWLISRIVTMQLY